MTKTVLRSVSPIANLGLIKGSYLPKLFGLSKLVTRDNSRKGSNNTSLGDWWIIRFRRAQNKAVYVKGSDEFLKKHVVILL